MKMNNYKYNRKERALITKEKRLRKRMFNTWVYGGDFTWRWSFFDDTNPYSRNNKYDYLITK